MKLFTSPQIKELDRITVEREPVSSTDLMERAAGSAAAWIMDRFSGDTVFYVFAGPGNNGGDGLVIARLLHNTGFDTVVVVPKISESFSPDFIINRDRLEKIGFNKIFLLGEEDQFPVCRENTVIVDALFGTGLNRPVDGFAGNLIEKINAVDVIRISIDIPSGLFSEDNSSNMDSAIVRADYTLSFEFPKIAFMFASNEQYVGEVVVLPIGLDKQAICDFESDYYYIDEDVVRPILKKRKKFSHKGNYGHALFIGGSKGKMGAVVLGVRATLRGGAGLVSCHIPYSGNDIVQIAIPEAMVSADSNDFFVTALPDTTKYSAVGVGPGMGVAPNSFGVLYNLLTQCSLPLVVDADAINILSANKEWLKKIAPDTILTPHPKEFERVAGGWNNDYEKLRKQIKFSMDTGCIIVLKGACSSVSFPDGRVWFNSSGNPGMATAGSGDVLTGIVLSLLAQGYTPGEAAIAGVFIHGLAGDIASEKMGESAMIASDIIDNIGAAYDTIIDNG
jgi:NAD(P)H-hydrate epimerase